MKPVLLAAALFCAFVALPSAPAAAEDWVIKDVFGAEKCPTSNGEEIVVCRRLPESEKYRIPKDLREAAKGAGPPGWAQRVQALEYVGSGGINSCSPVGSGGYSGCFSQLMNQARAERKADKKAEAAAP
mgnify:CR=1 FL=1